MSTFNEDAGRFATTREEFARVQAHIDRTIDDIRISAVKLAVQEILDGHLDAARDVMADCLTQQLDLAKVRVRHLQAVTA